MRNTPNRPCSERTRRHDNRWIWLFLLLLLTLLLIVLFLILQKAATTAGSKATEAPLSAQALSHTPVPLLETADDAVQATPVPPPQPTETPTPTSAPAPTPEPTPCFPLVARCFDGQADYCYFDERLAVQIQRHSDGELAYFICDIQTTDPTALRTALSEEKVYGSYEHTSDIASRHDAVLAINGDDYGVHRNGVIIRGGELIRAKKTTRHLLILDAAGNLEIVTDSKSETPKARGERLLSEGVRETWEFGPELVRDGQAVPFPSAFDLISLKNKALEPRTAIGQVGPLHYVIIVVDGRREGYSSGIPLIDLQRLFVNTGAQTAFNLDGGGSTTLYFCGQVLNRPSGGEQRSVSDILYF